VSDTLLDNPVKPPTLGEARLAQMRTQLLAEVERDKAERARRQEARLRPNRRRRLLVIVAAALAVFYAVPAVAQERWWWVSSPNDSMQPTTQVLTVGRWTSRELKIHPEEGGVPSARFDAVGGHWLLQAFINQRGMLCVGVMPDPPKLANDVGGFIACGHPIHGVGPAATAERNRHWVGFGTAIPGKVESAKARFMFGPSAANVREVDLANEDGRVIRVPTMAAPEGLGVPARFWIAVVPMEQLVHTLVPRDEDGKALEHWRLPVAQ
jgi:hypothetical protein